MIPPFRLLAMLCCGGWLLAQSVNDLNSLAIQGHRYAAHEAAGRKSVPALSLYKIIGTVDGTGIAVMEKGVELQHWTLIYKIDPPNAPGPVRPEDAPQSLTVQCSQGLFKDLAWSPLPVFDCKCMEWAWFTISLDEAIGQLRSHGYTRGFTNLTLMRPLYWRYSDECTYVFKCAPDHAYVGISAQTGALLWSEAIPPAFSEN